MTGLIRFLAAAIIPLALFGFCSCEREGKASANVITPAPRVETPKPFPAISEVPIPASREVDDLARFLAGMDGNEGSPYRIYELEIPWIHHAKAFDKLWDKFERDRRPAMHEWQKSELPRPESENGTVFYPFGGPDVLTAATFFPNYKDYVLVGLEPPGTLPTFDQVTNSKPLQVFLPNVRKTLSSLLTVSFFVTREMDFQLRGQITNGLLPVILVQMARMGFHINGISYVTLDENGKVVERKLEEERGGMVTNRGMAIEFQKEGDSVKHRLFYFSLNLASDRLGKNQPFLSFLSGGQHLTTMFKSTSYMPHREQFDLIRKEVLSRSAVVVQDDSGIPFRFFDQGQWRVQLYGGYDRPYGSFHYLQQPDLKSAYSKSDEVKRLGFGIGYGYGRIPSNLLVAKKKG